jgi:hypothetical protein
VDGISRPSTPRQQVIASAAGRKLGAALASINGYCLGLKDFNITLALDAASDEDIAAWRGLAGDAVIELTRLRRALNERTV